MSHQIPRNYRWIKVQMMMIQDTVPAVDEHIQSHIFTSKGTHLMSVKFKYKTLSMYTFKITPPSEAL